MPEPEQQYIGQVPIEQYLNLKTEQIHQQNAAVGWWDDLERCLFEVLQLIVTEAAEATEGERKDLMDDHLPNRKMGEVELADTLIRLLDLAGFKSWKLLPFNRAQAICVPSSRVAARHFEIVKAVCSISTTLKASEFIQNATYTTAVKTIMEAASSQNYDIIGAMNEKLKYNKERADHKRENRAMEGGKAF